MKLDYILEPVYYHSMVNVLDITTQEEWNTHKTRFEGDEEVIIFKFSPICPVSRTAENLFGQWLKKISISKKLSIIKVNVIRERTLSSFLAEDLGIKHESPQVIWLNSDLSIKWSGSHYSISEKALNTNF